MRITHSRSAEAFGAADGVATAAGAEDATGSADGGALGIDVWLWQANNASPSANDAFAMVSQLERPAPNH